MSEFTQRLRDLDHQVEQLRTALATLQRQLAGGQPANRAAWTWDAREAEDYLRAYS
jgi:hypothetical protein